MVPFFQFSFANTFFQQERRFLFIYDIKELNDSYAKSRIEYRNEKDVIILDLAYAKSLIELSYFNNAFVVLKKHRRRIKMMDHYTKGCYQLVMARLYSKINKSDEAFVLNKKAIAYLKKYPKEVELKMAYINHGFYATKIMDHKSAKVSLDKALSLEKKGVNGLELLLRTNYAFNNLIKNDLVKAKFWTSQANQMQRTVKDNYLDQYRLIIIQASIAEAEKNDVLKEVYLEKAANIARNQKLNDLLKSVYNSQSVNAAKKENYQKAHSLMLQVDSLNSILPTRIVAEQLAMLDLEDKIFVEKQINKFAKEKLNLKEQQQWLLLTLILTLMIFLLIVIVFLLNLRKKRDVLLKQNILLASQSQKRVVLNQGEKNVDLELIKQIESLIYDEKLYQDSNLTLEYLAKMLLSNRTYLSEAINQFYKMSFSAWLAGIRVTEARKLLLDPENDRYSIEGISKMVGFTSISSFNISFKKITGLTPTAFKNGRSKF